MRRLLNWQRRWATVRRPEKLLDGYSGVMSRRGRAIFAGVVGLLLVAALREGSNSGGTVSKGQEKPASARKEIRPVPISPDAPLAQEELHVGTSRAREGLLGWDGTIVSRSVTGALRSGASLGGSDTPGVVLSPASIAVDSGWYHYAIPWGDVSSVYCATTMDEGNPEVLCILRADGTLIVLSDLALGEDTVTTAVRAEQYLAAAQGRRAFPSGARGACGR